MRRTALLTTWLLSDLLVFVGSYVVAYFVRVGWILSSDFPLPPFLTVTILVAPVWLLTLVATRTFALTRNQRSPRVAMYVTYACVIGTALFALAYYFLYGLFFSRLLLLQALVISVAAVWAWHALFDALQRDILRRDPPEYPTLVIGATREAARLIRALQQSKHPLKPVAILDGRGAPEKEIEGVPVLGKLDRLERTLSDRKITHMIQCSDLEQAINLLSACRARGITYMLLPSVLGILERDERIESLEGRPVTVVRPPQKPWAWFFQ